MSNPSADDRHFVAFPQFQLNQAHIALPSQFARYGEAAKSIAMPIRRNPSRHACPLPVAPDQRPHFAVGRSHRAAT